MNTSAQASNGTRYESSGVRTLVGAIVTEWLAHLRASGALGAARHESAWSLDDRTLEDIGLHGIRGGPYDMR